MYRNQEIGKLGEEIASNYLIEQGYHIYQKNFRCQVGEIDIIAIDKIDKNELVFIEVKTRCQNKFGEPIESVNHTKIKHLYKAAESFLMINKLENTYTRFDVIEIYEKPNKLLHINHLKNVMQSKNEI